MHRIPIPEFKVLMYGPGIPPAGVKARAHFEPGVLVVQGKGHWYTIHADRITLKTGGYDGRQWLISWYSPNGPMTAMLQGEEAVDAFIRLAPDEVSGELHRVRRTHSRREWLFRSGMALMGLLLLVPLLLLGGFWIYADDLSRWAADHISVEQEVRLGDMAFEQMRSELKLRESGPAHDTVELIGVRLTAGTANYRYNFHVAEDPQVNAFALPGGRIVVYSGLLRQAESAEEVAGVLAHEISHVELRHTLRNLIHSLGWRAVLGAVVGDLSGGVWADMAHELGRLGYSRDLEREADLAGLQLLRRSGVPAAGMLDFYERMERNEKAPPALLSTHPSGLERMTILREAIVELGDYPSQPIGIDWDRVVRYLPSATVK